MQRVTERARRVLKEYFQKDRLAESISKAEAVRRILRGRGAELADVYLGWLAAQKVLTVQGDQVTLPGRSAQLTSEESKLSVAVLERYEKAGLRRRRRARWRWRSAPSRRSWRGSFAIW